MPDCRANGATVRQARSDTTSCNATHAATAKNGLRPPAKLRILANATSAIHNDNQSTLLAHAPQSVPECWSTHSETFDQISRDRQYMRCEQIQKGSGHTARRKMTNAGRRVWQRRSPERATETCCHYPWPQDPAGNPLIETGSAVQTIGASSSCPYKRRTQIRKSPVLAFG